MADKHRLISQPLAREEGLLVEEIDGDTVVYDLETKQVHCLKSLAAVLFSEADGSKTLADIAELSSHRLSRPVSEAELREASEQLEACGLLHSPTLGGGQGVSRRDALRTFAVAGASAALITTIAAPTALAQGSQIATGNCCGSTAKGDTCEGLNPTCQSNHCCQNNGGKSCNECKCVGDKNDCETGVACTSNSQCGAGEQCITSGMGAGFCCTVIVAPGGGTVSC